MSHRNDIVHAKYIHKSCAAYNLRPKGKEGKNKFSHDKINFPSTTPHLFNTEQCHWCSMFLLLTVSIVNPNQT